MERKYLGYGLSLLVLVLSLGTTACRFGVDDASPAATPVGGTPPTPQLDINGFHYAFDGDTNNPSIITDSLLANDAPYNGDPVLIEINPSGKVGKSAFFAAGSAIQLTPVVGAFPFENGLTFRAWVYLDHQVTSRQQIIGGTADGIGGTIVDNIGVSLDPNAIVIDLPVSGGIGTMTVAYSPSVNTWFHLAVTYFNNSVAVYINGVWQQTDTINVNFTNSFNNRIGNNLRIDNGLPVIENQFYGQLDEIYLENYIMRSAYISDYYRQTCDCIN
ncbi:MAG: LamG domain-containing protein [Gammaproteobacteria bacterium]|nr:LamG domain-containing protein [Gammaproteobacteria bacterium]